MKSTKSLGNGKFSNKTVALGKECVTSIGGLKCVPDYSIDEIPQDYAALILIGGLSWRSDDADKVKQLALDCAKSGRVLGAIRHSRGVKSEFVKVIPFLNRAFVSDLQGTHYFRGELKRRSAVGSDYISSPRSPSIVKLDRINYIAVRGKGDPNQEDGEYKKAIGLLRLIIIRTDMHTLRA